MKRILFAIALILFIGVSCTDKKDKPVLDGIFEIKIGMTESQIRQLVDTTLLEETNVLAGMDEDDLTDNFNGYEGLDTKAFYLKEYEVDTSLILKEIHLSFYQDTLYSVILQELNVKFFELLDQKYKISNMEQIDRGEEEQSSNKMMKATWKTNKPNIECYTAYTVGTNPFFMFWVVNTKVYHKIEKQIESQKKEQKQKEDQPILDRL